MAPPGGPSSAHPFATYLGLRWEADDRVLLPVRPDLVNSIGKLLGPVVFALADYAMGGLVWANLADDEACATTNVAINFVDSAASGEVVCTAKLDRRTRRVAATSCTIAHADGRLLATAIGSFAIIAPPSPPA